MDVEIPEWNRFEEIKTPHSMSLSVLLEYRMRKSVSHKSRLLRK